MKRLQLKKHDVKSINPYISEAIIKYLEEALADIENLIAEDVKSIIDFQDKDGGFRPFVGEWIYDSDAYKRVADYPSYLCTLILINADLLNITKVDKACIEKAFGYITKHGLRGHGYDAALDEVNNINLFLANGLKHYLSKYPNDFKSFKSFVEEAIKHYRSLYKTGKTVVGFGIDIRKEIAEMLDNADYTYYVAYGSNLNKGQMEDRCSGAELVETQTLKGYRLDFHLYLTITRDDKYNTPVAIWKINPDHEKSLDRYEGVRVGLYRKEYIRLIVLNSKRYCLVYLMNDIPERKNVVPTDRYIKTCMDGYRDLGFDESILAETIERVNALNN